MLNSGLSGLELLAGVILLLRGDYTKSAVFPFYFWLPDVMQSPSPVSAYRHLATMVKAGIAMLTA